MPRPASRPHDSDDDPSVSPSHDTPGHAWAARIRAGDAEAFNAMFLAHYAPLVRFAYRYVGTQADAEEIVQDVMVRVWEQRATLPDDTGLRPWLYATVRNRAIDHLRHHHRVLQFEERAAREDAAPAMGEAASTADEVLAAEDLERRVVRAIEALPLRCRQVFLLHRVHHLTHAEIAVAMGISSRTVQVQMGRALKALRRCLGATPAD